MKWLILGVILVLLPGLVQAVDFWGVGLYEGSQVSGDPIWHSTSYNHQEVQGRVQAGWHLTEKSDVWVEGEVGWLKWRHSPGLTLGVLLMIDYDLIRYRALTLSAEIGVGVGWRSDSPSSNTLGQNPTGLIDYGLAIEYKSLRIGPRFHHTSSIFGRDSGINTYGILAIIRF